MIYDFNEDFNRGPIFYDPILKEEYVIIGGHYDTTPNPPKNRRLFFDNILHIQASWPTMGMGVAQLALFAGADDAGSTMMEENVVSASGTEKTCALEWELQDAVRRAGFEPTRRDSDYNLLETPKVSPDVNSFPAPPPMQP